jgi:hypothetical protein
MARSVAERRLGQPAGRVLLGCNVLIVGFGALGVVL